MFLSSAVLALTLQAAPAKVPDGTISETWELAYDVAITPYIEDYRRCLNYGNRVISPDAPDFELQHRNDVPRCMKVYERSVKASNRMMERRGRSDVFTPEDVMQAFDTVGYIHIQRGRFIDERFEQRRLKLAQYQAQANQPSAPLDEPMTTDLEKTPLDAEN